MDIRKKSTYCCGWGGDQARRVVQPKEVGKLANKLLTFAINGLSHSFCIIVGYFLLANLTAEELSQWSEHTFKEVESVGYSIEGIAADNASINKKMFKMLNPGGKVSHVIPIPTAKKKFLCQLWLFPYH
jgi:hypothetical protein